VNFFLQVYSNSAITANDLIGAHARVGRNVTAGIRDADIFRYVADRVVSALNGGGNQAACEFLMRSRRRGLRLGSDVRDGDKKAGSQKEEQACDNASHSAIVKLSGRQRATSFVSIHCFPSLPSFDSAGAGFGQTGEISSVRQIGPP
jgi:hypothetical protein